MPPLAPFSYGEALEFLYGRIDYERAAATGRELHLDRMRRLMARLGDPHLRIPVVHVAGTKGKGSVSAMLSAILQAAGCCSGLYTSPHLERLEERFAIDGRQCNEHELAALTEGLRPAVEQLDRANEPPTFFEVTTAMAYMHFAQRPVDAAVVEVGMGGRLDSTNVCHPCLTVITSISFDHTAQLGNTLEAIAGEKAGIIKPGVPVISGVVAPAARDVIADVARSRGCRVVQLGADFDYLYLPDGPSLRYAVEPSSGGSWSAKLPLGMLGRHQAANAAIALAAVDELVKLGWQIGEGAIAQGLALARCPARIEVISTQPTVILDAAHNAASAAALAATLAEQFGPRRKRLLFAIAREKDIASVLRPLAPLFEEIVVTRFQSNPRGADPAAVACAARELEGADWRVTVIDNPLAAWEALRQSAAPDDLLCIAGSFFLAAELRGRLLQTASTDAKIVVVP